MALLLRRAGDKAGDVLYQVCGVESTKIVYGNVRCEPTLQELYVYLLGISIFLELSGGVLFVLGSKLGASLLVRYPPPPPLRIRAAVNNVLASSLHAEAHQMWMPCIPPSSFTLRLTKCGCQEIGRGHRALL